MKAANDLEVHSLEAKEILSDMKAMDVRWSAVKRDSEKQSNRLGNILVARAKTARICLASVQYRLMYIYVAFLFVRFGNMFGSIVVQIYP